MKKLRYFLTLAVVLSFSAMIFAGCSISFGGSDYKQFVVHYTENLQFLVGEDYYDARLKGVATKKDDTTVDVTDRMTVNTSEFKKETPGVYKIYCEFEGIKVNYEVSVVSEITNIATINARIENVQANTFKRDAEGVFSYEASNSSEYSEGVNFNEYMIYIDDNGELSIYLRYEAESSTEPEDKQTAIEYWYYGTEDDGSLTMKTYDGEEKVETVTDMTLSDFQGMIVLISAEMPVSIIPYGMEDTLTVADNATLVRNQDGSYTLTEIDDSETYVVSYKDNIFTEIYGVEYIFPKSSTAEIPAKPADTENE